MPSPGVSGLVDSRAVCHSIFVRSQVIYARVCAMHFRIILCSPGRER